MRILFVTSTRIGDAILSTGLLSHLIDSYPGASITVACGPAPAPLFAAVPGLEKVIVLDKMLFSLHWVRLWALCANRYWDQVIDLRNAPLTYLLPYRRRHGITREKHTRRRVELLAGVLDLDPPPAPRLWIAPVHRERATAAIPSGPPVLAIGPTANWRAKTWRADRFGELAHRLTASDGILPGGRVAIFGRKDERPQALRTFEYIPEAQRIDLIGRLDLLSGFACLERCQIFIGNDSGLMHLAAASGTPTLGLFGPTDERLYAPWGANADFVRTTIPYAEIFPANFDHRRSDSLMDSLTVDMAEAASVELWQRSRPAAMKDPP